MASQLAAICDAVKNALAGAAPGTFVLPFVPQRVYVPLRKLEALNGVQVLLFVPEAAYTVQSRSRRLQADVRVEIGVIKKVAADATAEAGNVELDELNELCEQITAFFTAKAYGPAKWFSTERPLLY